MVAWLAGPATLDAYCTYPHFNLGHTIRCIEMPEKSYVIITPAFNEAGFIEETIHCVVNQSALPHKWIIVDDGSEDETPEIVESAAAEHDWIELMRRSRREKDTYFASNVYAIMEGVESVRSEEYAYLAILDSDITLPATYYETILDRMEADTQLGIASGIYENLIDGQLHKVINDRRSTPKAIQVFRRQCFETINGFLPLRHGGEDTCACFSARMHHWKTWSFPDVKVVHRRPTGTGNARSLLRARFNQGLCEYGLATHPLFMLGKSLKRGCLEAPLVLGGAVRMLGYLTGMLSREERQISKDLIDFIRSEQLARVLKPNTMPDKYKVSEK